MTQITSLIHNTNCSHTYHDVKERTLLGFWAYLMSDCLLFASLFAAYAVLHNSTYGGPSSYDLFQLPFVLAETLILLTSSFTCGLTLLASHQHIKSTTLFQLAITMLLGVIFLLLELHEFYELVLAGNSWHKSAFLSSYFTLVGTHGLHILFGILWACVLGYQIISRGFCASVQRRLLCFSLFWHFLDIIWVFIFTIVYLMGVI